MGVFPFQLRVSSGAREEVSGGSLFNVYSIRINNLPVAVIVLLIVIAGTPTMRIIMFLK